LAEPLVGVLAAGGRPITFGLSADGALVAGTGEIGHHRLGVRVMVERATGVSRWWGETC
jgi:hypothetical protein